MVFFSQVRLKIQSAMKHQKETISMFEVILHGLFLNRRLSTRLSLSFLTSADCWLSSVGLYLGLPRHSVLLLRGIFLGQPLSCPVAVWP